MGDNGAGLPLSPVVDLDVDTLLIVGGEYLWSGSVVDSIAFFTRRRCGNRQGSYPETQCLHQLTGTPQPTSLAQWE